MIEFLIGTAAASGAIGIGAAVVRAARGYHGGWSDHDVEKINTSRGTQAPAWNTPEFNRYQPPPASQPDTAEMDLIRRREAARKDAEERYGWIREGPKADPPEYDGPRGRE